MRRRPHKPHAPHSRGSARHAAAQPTPARPATPRPATAGQNGVTSKKKAVLVLEDHASVGGLIAGLLRQEGYRVVRAWDAQEAVRLSRGRPVDAVVLDLNLAYPGGLDGMLQPLRANDSTRRTPVVLVTGATNALMADESGAVAEVVKKPFDIDIMLNAVRKAVGDPVVEVTPRQYEAQDYFLHGY